MSPVISANRPTFGGFAEINSPLLSTRGLVRLSVDDLQQLNLGRPFKERQNVRAIIFVMGRLAVRLHGRAVHIVLNEKEQRAAGRIGRAKHIVTAAARFTTSGRDHCFQYRLHRLLVARSWRESNDYDRCW